MKDFAKILLKWYCVYKRPLPWRDTSDPYLIWISEVILQQTRVSQGYDYFLRFIKRFPDIQTLARASEDEVLKYWEGLGYYSRARNLHEAAQSVKGVFPSTYEDVLSLKGVGEYTAAAICSFAYKMPYAVVDGNVRRVLARIFGISEDMDSAAGKKQTADLAQKLLDKTRPDDYNQAIMDFGALQCVPGRPNCERCPFLTSCVAYRTDRVELLPLRRAKPPFPVRYLSYIYVKQAGDTWLRRRDKQDIWRGLYEPVLIETSSEMTAEDLINTDLWREYFGGNTPRFLRGPVRHILSHRVLCAHFYTVSLSEAVSPPAGFIRVPFGQVKRYALPRLVQKLLYESELL